MKKRIVRLPASTVRILVAGTLLSTKRARRRNVREVAQAGADTAVGVAVIAVGVAVVGVVVIAGTAEIAATAGNARFPFPYFMS
jgi:hypothetical protein